MDKLLALDEVMTTLLRIKNEGLELNMEDWYTNISVLACDTVCCVAGWHQYFDMGPSPIPRPGSASEWANKIADTVMRSDETFGLVKEILFGSERSNDVDQQIYVTRWFIAREERLESIIEFRLCLRESAGYWIWRPDGPGTNT